MLGWGGSGGAALPLPLFVDGGPFAAVSEGFTAGVLCTDCEEEALVDLFAMLRVEGPSVAGEVELEAVVELVPGCMETSCCV